MRIEIGPARQTLRVRPGGLAPVPVAMDSLLPRRRLDHLAQAFAETLEDLPDGTTTILLPRKPASALPPRPRPRSRR